ncbi:MAG: formate dehydrogenase accessory sulfurtransferase FdhD [Gemmatimonadaceae bacterium]
MLRLADTRQQQGEWTVAEEVPIALVYNRRAHAVMMGTPQDLEDFAVGFTISEGIAAAGGIGAVRVEKASHGIELQVEIPPDAADRPASRGRAIAGRTGCGLCGVEAIDDMLRTPPRVASEARFAPDALFTAAELLPHRQEINKVVHSVHAAAFASATGTLHLVREDVGRHNALDKLLGAVARGGMDASKGFVVVTSRASYELVQKVATAGIPLLAAISQPTGLAVRMAESCGVTLVALLRGRSADVYAHPERLGAAAPPAARPKGAKR